jgi:hypothetical protein
MGLLVETLLVSLGLMGVEAAVNAAKAAATSGASAADIAAAAVNASGKKIPKKTIDDAVRRGMDASAAARAAEVGAGAHAATEAARIAQLERRWGGRHGRLARYGGTAMTSVFALSMLPMLAEMFRGREEEAPAGVGGQDQDMLSMLAAMQGLGGGGGDLQDLREMAAGTGGQADMMNRRALIGSFPSSLGTGAAGLEELIRGNRELLGEIAYTEPMSFAQAYARQGLYGSPQTPAVNFEDIL